MRRFSLLLNINDISFREMNFSVFCVIVAFLFHNVSPMQDFSSIGVIVTRIKQFKRIPLTNLNSLIRYSGFDSRLPTIFYVPGWLGDANSYCTKTVRKAYYKKDFNFLILDWIEFNRNDLITTNKNIGPVGNAVGEKLYQMAKNGLINLNSWHFMGHSVATHLASWIAKSVRVKSSGKIVAHRVTGLDPSGLFVYDSYYGKPIIEEVIGPDAGTIEFIYF